MHPNSKQVEGKSGNQTDFPRQVLSDPVVIIFGEIVLQSIQQPVLECIRKIIFHLSLLHIIVDTRTSRYIFDH